jgi:hypothetical protein
MEKKKIHNVPEYAYKYKYIVHSIVNGEFWFYGAYNDIVKAMEAAAAIQGSGAEAGEFEAV